MEEKLLSLFKEIKAKEKEIKILSIRANFNYISAELDSKFKFAVKKMQDLYDSYKFSFGELFREENILLKENLKRIENEALEEAKGPTRDHGCDFFNFVIFN